MADIDIHELIEQLTVVEERVRDLRNGLTTVAEILTRGIDKTEQPPRRQRPTYSPEFRRQVVRAIGNGMSFNDAAKKWGVSWFTAREWSRKEAADGPVKAAPKKGMVAKKKSTRR